MVEKKKQFETEIENEEELEEDEVEKVGDEGKDGDSEQEGQTDKETQDDKLENNENEEQKEGLEEKRKRRAEERKANREARRLAKIRDKLTIQRLQQQIKQLTDGQEKVISHITQQTVSGVDDKISRAQSTIEAARTMQMNAINKGDVQSQIAAEDMLYKARNDLNGLMNYKQQITQTGREDTSDKPDPRIRSKAQAWVLKTGFNTWSTQEQNLAKAIDEELTEEKYDAGDDSYYEELNRRIGEILPERVGIKKQQPVQVKKEVPRSVTGSNGGAGAGGGDKYAKGIPTYVVDEWKRAGRWEDDNPKQKERMRANYFETLEREKR